MHRLVIALSRASSRAAAFLGACVGLGVARLSAAALPYRQSRRLLVGPRVQRDGQHRPPESAGDQRRSWTTHEADPGDPWLVDGGVTAVCRMRAQWDLAEWAVASGRRVKCWVRFSYTSGLQG